MGFRYQLLEIPDFIKDPDDPEWNISNPDAKALREGTYVPPEGSRVVGFLEPKDRRIHAFVLLLEFDIIRQHPYR